MILHNIDKVDKNKLFTLSEYTSTHGHSLKLFKRRSRLKIRANSFSNKVVDTWNTSTEQVVQAPSLNCFKSRLNNWWKHHPSKFDQACYIPGQTTRIYTNNPNASGRVRDASYLTSTIVRTVSKKLEMTKRMAARWVKNQFSPYESVTNMLSELGWRSLEDRRIDARLIMFYKIVHGYDAIL